MMKISVALKYIISLSHLTLFSAYYFVSRHMTHEYLVKSQKSHVELNRRLQKYKKYKKVFGCNKWV